MANRVYITGIKEFNAAMKRLQTLPKDVMEQELENLAFDAADYMRREAPVDTGNLRRNIKVEKTAEGMEISSQAFNGLGDDYAPHVEYGTRRNRAQPYFWHNAPNLSLIHI